MCGIAGFWQQPDTAERLAGHAEAMTTSLLHRGPDDGGTFVDCGSGIGLGFRRLAIVDLSPGGHQPMMSHSGRHVVVFNGEIYNFLEIRRELERAGQQFVSTSDTEVLVNAFDMWGVEPTLRRLNGMFAFAVWDRTDRTLTLARDRIGKKPLYYGWERGTLLFGSELKALCSHPAFSRTLDRSSLTLFMRLGYVPAPHSIYQNVFKLRAGHFVTVSAPQQRAKQRPYWSIGRAVQASRDNQYPGDFTSAVDQLDELLHDSVRLRMLADVPVGAFLSGGIDSSLIVAVMQAQQTSGVKTFTIAFNEASHDEGPHAAAMARHLGTEHTHLCVSPQEAQAAIPLMPRLYDEPFADSSQIPTFLVSRLARQRITVSLSGDGGDELFGGYEEYRVGARRWKVLRRLSPVRPLIHAGLRSINAVTEGRYRTWEQILEVTTPEALHQFHSSRWRRPSDLVPGSDEHRTAFTDTAAWLTGASDTERMMYMDLVSYLPEDILTKLDRASMGVSLESRVPLLDYRIVEFAWRLPLDFRIHAGQGKRILRALLGQYVPTRLFERPKMGFNLPLYDWLRGPLRSWAEDLLDPASLKRQALLEAAPVRRAWEDHLRGSGRDTGRLWNVLMFQAWQNEWLRPADAPSTYCTTTRKLVGAAGG
jgi:asparagine synthase (glutamine-hydrolysing)